MQFDLRLLPAFVAVADELHFGRAADRLQMAQPALSQQIARLETQLGTRLLERDARSVALTAAGAAFLPEARLALESASRAAAAALSAAAGHRPTLGLAVDLDVPARILERVHTFVEARPDVELGVLRAHQGRALAALHEHEVDVVLGWARIPHGPPLRSVVVDSVEVVAVIRSDHPEAHRLAMPRDAFARHRFVMFERYPSVDVHDWLVSAATGRQPEQLDIEHVSSVENGTAAMLRAAAAGCGLTLAIKDALDGSYQTLRAISFAPPLFHDVTVMWRPQSESELARAFIRHCTSTSVARGSDAEGPT